LPTDRIVIEGGAPLRGSVKVGGSKNAADSMLAACLLTGEECILENVPEIDDVRMMASILDALGARVQNQGGGRWRIQAADLTRFDSPNELAARQRASFLVMGPLLARYGQGASCSPGGDVIGTRPLDVHFEGFRALGATVSRRGEQYLAERSPERQRLRAARIFLDYPSVTGSLNVIFAAVLAEGTSTIINAAVEPEIVSVIDMLNRMGAKIRGAGKSIVEIEGVDELNGVSHSVIPDRLETGMFALAGAITGGEVEVENCRPEHLDALITKMRQAGLDVRAGDSTLYVCGEGRRFHSVRAQAVPYPGLATDLHPLLAAFLTQAHGVSVIHERVYENRLLYIGELRKMGADVISAGATAIITGPTRLYGTPVKALDVRAGGSLVLSALAAEGRTEIGDVYHLDRAHEDLEGKLRGLGASVDRG
jgi:UDP-N-acetylglucosamine 1-carboxyvinyltransferase